MTMSKVNAYKNIQLHDILLTTANNNNNRNNKKYYNYTYKYNKFKRYNNNNSNDDKKIEKKIIKSSDSNKIYEVVEAKKCIETQIYVQTQREGGTFEASSAAFPLKHPWPHNKLIRTTTTTTTTTTINSHEQGELKKKGEEQQQKQQAVICDNKTDIDTEDRMQWCAKLRQTWRRISSRTWCSIDASLWHDAAYRIIVMLFVAAVAISGTAEVSAAHRSTHKHESDVGVSKNKNEIPFGFNDLVNSNANTNINNFDYANTVAMSSTTSMVNDSSATGSVSYTTTSVTAASILSSLPAIQIPSGSLQKVSNSGGTGGGSGSGKGVNRNSIEIGEENRNSGPYFDKSASKNVTALLGKTAYLNCRVKNLGNKTMLLQVSWVRHRDIHLLTVGRYTYTSDQRFRAIHQPQTEDWLLQIKYPQHRDSGVYECQVSTTPHMSHYIHLNVVEPSTEIIGAPDLYIESGSTINLTCVIWNSPEPPAYIFWNHNNAIINYDSPRGGVSVVTLKGETTTSFLLIKAARPSDSGHYQCNPSNAKPKSVTVHVLNGVSHSVSREIPSSNAARGTIASTNDAKSNNICVPVYILIHFSILQTLMALEKSVAENCWLVLKGLSRLLISQLISDLIFYKFKHFIHKLLYLKCFWSETLVSQTDQCLKLKNEFDIR